ncbi:RNA polymerase sigma factor [Oryzobacter sp. R7]|uniref:RNA polymerase sigma factor n=1 Tax=Oryzobacter faecalis TaxID=3388656 RepID=UPI00398CCC56
MRDRPGPEGGVVAGGESLADFVRSRWGDLEPVAQLVLLDPGLARDVTTTALARLAREWSGVSEEGRPVEEARRLVLRSALDRAGPRTTDPPDEDVAADPVRAALVEHLRALDPLARALVATAHVWAVDAPEAARLLGRSSAGLVASGVDVRRGLEDAHTAARAAAGEEPAPWAFDHDLGAALDLLLGDLAPLGAPPDPVELVERRSGRVRRRGLLVGGAVVLGGAGVAAALGLRGGDPSAPTAPPLPAATDRAWYLTSRWPVRGPLATDPGLRAFRSRRLEPTDRILWVGDVGTRRVLVGWTTTASDDGRSDSSLRLFTGPTGADPTSLDEVTPEWSHVDSPNAVVVAVPDGPEVSVPRTILVVLAMPTETTARFSRVVRPLPSGELGRSWVDLPLRGGVSASLVGGWSPALRVRLGLFDGPPVSPFSPFGGLDVENLDPADAVDRIERFVSSATGIPESALRSEVVSDDPLPAGLFDDPAGTDRGAGARLRRYLTTTPDGAVLRSALYLESGRGQVVTIEVAMLVPAGHADRPSMAWATEVAPGRPRFVVLHQVAATVQLVTTDGAVRSAVVSTGGRRATVLDVRLTAEPLGDFLVVLRDGRGREVFRGPPVEGRWLLDG